MEITLPYNFSPREYQLPIMEALDGGIKRLVWVAHRRSGKDKTCINLIAKKMMERVGVYYYIFPTYSQGRKILWEGIDKEGNKFLDHFPKELIDGKPNETEMKLKFKNGSLFQVIGSDNIDSIVGTNPVGVVFTEYSLQDPNAWGFIRPILAENGGWAIFVFTPRGENHGYDIYNLAKNSPDWFCQTLTVNDTKAIPRDVLDREKMEIVHEYGNDALYQQEYECNFTVPISGAYYAEQIMQAYKDGRVGKVPYEDRLLVDTWWDLGINDNMSIWFTQSAGAEIRLIDYYQNTGQGLPHYIQVLKDRGYIYGKHTAPHDIEVRELSSGVSRKDTAKLLGINFETAARVSVASGIDSARSFFRKCWFDSEKCAVGLNALKNYHKQYDEKRKTYADHPYHDWTSNAADAFRYLSVSYNFKLSENRWHYEQVEQPKNSGWHGKAYIPLKPRESELIRSV